MSLAVLSQANDLTTVSTEEIKQRLTTALAKTAEGLAEMAGCVRELEARGEDLSSIKLAVLPYLRRIACGQLLPQIVVSYAGSPRLLAAISSLPIPDQERLLDRGTVSVAVVETDGTLGTREIDPRAMPVRDIARVFSPEGIRSPAEQLPKTRIPREGRRYMVRVDKARQKIIVGRMSVPIAEVLTALAESAGWEGVIDEEHTGNMPTASAKLTKDEKDRLKAMSKATGLPEWEIVRRAILTWLV